MDDSISRQAAIDAVHDAFCYAYCDNCEKEMNEDLCGDCHRKYQNWSASKKIIEKVINNLPSVQPDPSEVARDIATIIENEKDMRVIASVQPERWIPCSKRLPDIGEHHVSEPCIVYCSNGAYGFAELEENIFGQVGWNCERDDEYHEPLGEVLAWMPLPEPYKGEQE